METKTAQKQDEKVVAARRRFLANCGKFAVVTPPVVSLMLAASERNYAVAHSSNYGHGGGGRGGRGGSHGNRPNHHGRGHSHGQGRGGRGEAWHHGGDRDRSRG